MSLNLQDPLLRLTCIHPRLTGGPLFCQILTDFARGRASGHFYPGSRTGCFHNQTVDRTQQQTRHYCHELWKFNSESNLVTKKLVIENDLLYRKWDDEKGTTLQAIVPLCERRKVLSYSLDHPTAGHLGIRKILSKKRQAYYWPCLQRDVRHYVAGCEKCQTSKVPLKTPIAPMQIVGASRHMERIATEILGELPLTDNGNRYILVISDYFTK